MSEDATTTPDTTTETLAPEAGADNVKTFSLEYVQQLRQENAAHRTAKTTAVEEVHAQAKAYLDAVIAERDVAYTELENELGKAQLELQKLYTTIDAKVPSDKVRQFTAILQGTDEESIKASAASNLELIGGFGGKPVPGFDPTQGSGGRKDIPLNGDPILAAIQKAVGISP